MRGYKNFEGTPHPGDLCHLVEIGYTENAINANGYPEPKDVVVCRVWASAVDAGNQHYRAADVMNTEQILNYGAAAQKNVADFSESALSTVRTKDLGEVGGQTLGVAVVPAGNRHFVRHAASFEAEMGEGAHLDRMVDQLVVVGGAVEAEAQCRGSAALSTFSARRRERSGHAPALEFASGRWLQVDEAGRVLLAEHAQEDAGAVEEAVCRVEVGATYREVPGVDGHGHRQRGAILDRRGLPGVLVELVEAHGFAAGFGADGDHMAGEFTNQVAARNPRRQSEALATRRRARHGAADFEMVCGRVGRENAIAEGRERHEGSGKIRVGGGRFRG